MAFEIQLLLVTLESCAEHSKSVEEICALNEVGLCGFLVALFFYSNMKLCFILAYAIIGICELLTKYALHHYL